MDDMAMWLRQQLDEDEGLAEAAAPGPWEYQDIESVGGGRVCDPDVEIASVRWDNNRVDPRIRRTVPEGEADRTGEHIARHNPTRVLAMVDAAQRILDHHAPQEGERQRICAECGGRDMSWPCLTVRLLALPYADRPGYRDEWKP